MTEGILTFSSSTVRECDCCNARYLIKGILDYDEDKEDHFMYRISLCVEVGEASAEIEVLESLFEIDCEIYATELMIERIGQLFEQLSVIDG